MQHRWRLLAFLLDPFAIATPCGLRIYSIPPSNDEEVPGQIEITHYLEATGLVACRDFEVVSTKRYKPGLFITRDLHCVTCAACSSIKRTRCAA